MRLTDGAEASSIIGSPATLPATLLFFWAGFFLTVLDYTVISLKVFVLESMQLTALETVSTSMDISCSLANLAFSASPCKFIRESI